MKVRAYHGSAVPITRFDRKFSAQGVFWFTEDKDKILRGESGAVSSKYLMEVILTVDKVAGWAEYESLYLDQIKSMGFDSIKLDDDWIVFDSKRIKVIATERTDGKVKAEDRRRRTSASMKAFHHVYGGGAVMRTIIENGTIDAAAYRLEPEMASAICGEFLESRIILNTLDVDVDPPTGNPTQYMALQAFQTLLDQRVNEMACVSSCSEETNLRCQDILAGDIWYIFMSLGKFYGSADKKNGFAFDVDQLLSEGAIYRDTDLIDSYTEIVLNMFEDKHRSTQDTLRNLVDAFQAVRQEHEFTGKNAVKAISKAYRSRHGEIEGELIFPDKLPVKWATDMWINGRHVK